MNCIPILYPKSLTLCKNAVDNGVSLEVYIPFDFQLITYLVSLSFFDSLKLSVGWQTNKFWKPASPKKNVTKKIT